MTNINEEYVSFEIANLLKEKGFDNICNGYYNQEKTLQKCSLCSIEDTLKSPFYFDCIPAPTIQMAMKWLREVHNIVCNIDIESRNFYYYSVFIIRSSNEAQYQLTSQKPYFETYEEACEAAIKYCLENLI